MNEEHPSQSKNGCFVVGFIVLCIIAVVLAIVFQKCGVALRGISGH